MKLPTSKQAGCGMMVMALGETVLITIAVLTFIRKKVGYRSVVSQNENKCVLKYSRLVLIILSTLEYYFCEWTVIY